MNDETDKTDSAGEGPLGGERLRAARRANDISVADIAKELHLDEPKVRALERNEFDLLGAPVFAKGHLRKYAELVGVEVDDVMTDYYQMNRAAAVPPVVGPKRVHPRDINPMPWIAGAIVIIVASVAAYWWFALRSTEPVVNIEPATLAPFEALQDEPPAAAISADAATELTDPAEAAPVDTTVGLLPAAEESQIVYEPTSGAPQVTIDLAYSGDCWTEVSDASGRRLFYDLGTEGRVVTLSGDAPLRVILGDSEYVSVTVDGRAWPIPASARSGRLARLTLTPR
jgi:cytoskeleton protein RodZ